MLGYHLLVETNGKTETDTVTHSGKDAQKRSSKKFSSSAPTSW
jgi:hypothetical protein